MHIEYILRTARLQRVHPSPSRVRDDGHHPLGGHLLAPHATGRAGEASPRGPLGLHQRRRDQHQLRRQAVVHARGLQRGAPALPARHFGPSASCAPRGRADCWPLHPWGRKFFPVPSSQRSHSFPL